MNKIYSVAILGCGARGDRCYGELLYKYNNKYTIVSLCEILPDKLEVVRKKYKVDKNLAFIDENEFFKEKRADLLIISTQDKDHIRHCLNALKLGYKNILLEKPITANEEECYKLLEAEKKYGGKIVVAHVLRYNPSFRKFMEYINDDYIGELISIQALEQVQYWHQAHSYVRGNWRRSDETTPMILAKCCHDLDLIQYIVKAKCQSVSSFGSLKYFKKENAPLDGAKRCSECKYIETCPYSAKRIYIDMFKSNSNFGASHYLSVTRPLTVEAIDKAIKEGPYGRCVYHCDNNVVDNQVVSMLFENNVTATLTMMGPTANGGRIYKVYGSKGEVVWNEEKQIIEVKKFGEEHFTIDFKDLPPSEGGHGGADGVLINYLYDFISNDIENTTPLEDSIESHLIGIKAEKSRLENGKTLLIHDN